MTQITDKEYHRYGACGADQVLTTFGDERVKVNIDAYELDHAMPHEYQAYWHPVNIEEFD